VTGGLLVFFWFLRLDVLSMMVSCWPMKRCRMATYQQFRLQKKEQVLALLIKQLGVKKPAKAGIPVLTWVGLWIAA
jgi:hypothetical protein